MRLLGILLDRNLTLERQIDATIASSFFSLRQIKAIRKCLPSDAVKTLVSAFVMSRIDYCSTLYSGQPKKHFNRFQSVLNSAARLIFGISKFAHITPLLKKLHWLRFPERVVYRVCLMVYKAINGLAPPYLNDMISPVEMGVRRQTLRSASDGAINLVQPHRQIRTNFGDRAFRVAGPVEWNRLPPGVKNSESMGIFCGALKTHLFKKSYP